MKRIITINGHRPNRVGGYDRGAIECIRICNFIDTMVMALKTMYDDVRLISGGALGVDTYVIESSISLGVPLTIAAPFKGYTNKWSPEDQKHIRYLGKQVDQIYCVSQGGYTNTVLNDRNVWMLNNSDILISFYVPKAVGGIRHAIKYAYSIGLPMIIINPIVIMSDNPDYSKTFTYVDGSDPGVNEEIKLLTIEGNEGNEDNEGNE